MPTTDASQRLRGADVAAIVADACFGGRACQETADVPGRVGLETEFFAIANRRPRRLRMGEVHAIIDDLAAPHRHIRPAEVGTDGSVGYPVEGGGALTFEPGAQVEVSGPCRDTAAGALDDLAATIHRLARAFGRRDVALASAGTDVWTSEAVPQQLVAARYPAMARYFAARGPWGEVMMRQSASMQINLDPGAGTVAEQRYAASLLAAPVVAATFACSPSAPGSPRLGSRRATAWLRLDPTRTGIPEAFVEGGDDPVEVMTRAALDADVLLFRHVDGTAAPGRVGTTFASWMAHGVPGEGWPTAEDLRYHLTTLFHEARPRGALEVRGVDALPSRWRPVPVVLLCGLLYDPRARRRVLEVLEPRRADLPALARVAAAEGLAAPSLCALAVEVWSFALEGARRLPSGYLRDGDLALTEQFIDRYTTRGRAPGDELADLLADDPATALAWASEPLVTTARTTP